MPLSRIGGQVDYQGPYKVINGCAVLCRNMKHQTDQSQTRWGTRVTMGRQENGGLGAAADVTGIDVLNVIGQLNAGDVPVCFTSLGELLKESPAGSGAFVSLNPPYTLPLAAYMRTAKGNNDLYMAFTDGGNGLTPPIQYVGQRALTMPVSQNVIGALWKEFTRYYVGDLVRSPDGRWWKCIYSPGQEAGPNPPAWPTLNGQFAYFEAPPLTWFPATATDAVSGTVWEEWTPNVAQYLPAPDSTDGLATSHNPGTGSIPVGKDVYVKLTYSYTPLDTGVTVEGPRSTAITFFNTSPNDIVTFSWLSTGPQAGAPTLPRWLAEIKLNPNFFAAFHLNVWVAFVTHGAAAPADSAYGLYNNTSLFGVVVISSTTVTMPTYKQNASLAGLYLDPVTPGEFQGENGQRYFMMLRQDLNGSFYPVDPGSPIPVTLQGEVDIDIVTITRTSGGAVTATLGDVSSFIPGQTVTVAGCTTDSTFNGSFTVLTVETTLAPEGQLTWQDSSHMSASTDDTGQVSLPAGPAAMAFIPRCDNSDSSEPQQAGWAGQDMMALTVVGSPQAGPFFVLTEAEPAAVVTQTSLDLTYTNGNVTALMESAAGLAAGDVCFANYVGGFTNEFITIASINGNYITYQSTSLSGGSGAELILTVLQQLATVAAASNQPISTISCDAAGNVACNVSDATGFVVGETVFISGNSNGAFNGLQHLTGVVLNPDGITGYIQWKIPGISSPTTGNGGKVLTTSDFPLSYDDESLASGTDVTSQLTSLPVPPNASDICFIQAIQALAVVDNTNYPSNIVFTNEDDPANVTGDSGDPNNEGSNILSVDDNSSSLMVAVRELRNGEIVALKADGGYGIIPSENYPSQWSCPRRWLKYGPVGAAAVAISNSDTNDFLAFWSESGPYIYLQGQLTWIGKEIGNTLKRVNLQAKSSFWCAIDPDNYEIKFGVCLDGATTPNYELNCNYFNGFGEPEVLNRYGKLIASRDARRWSINPIAARCANYVKRTLTTPEPSTGVGSWPYFSAISSGATETVVLTYAPLTTGAPANVGDTLVTDRFGTVTVVSVQASQITCSGTGLPTGNYGSGTFTISYTIPAIPSDSRTFDRQFLYGLPANNAPKKALSITSLRRAGNVVTAVCATAGYTPVPREMLYVTVTGAADKSFNGQFAVTSYNQAGNVLTVTWAQVGPPGTTSQGTLFTTWPLLKVIMTVPDVYDDDGVGIDCQYQPWFYQQPPAVLKFMGYRGQVTGSGAVLITPVTDSTTQVYNTLQIPIPSSGTANFERGMQRMERKYGSLLMSNNQVPGAWFTIQELVVYGFAVRAGIRK